MNSLSFLALIVIVLAHLAHFAAANDPLLADAHDLGMDLKEHISSLAKEERLLEHMEILTETVAPTLEPTFMPSYSPTLVPTYTPSTGSTDAPTQSPTFAPTVAPTTANTNAPTFTQTDAPTVAPTLAPTLAPTRAPTTGSTPIISFSSSIGINGLTSDVLDTNTKESITEATCTTMNLASTACEFWGYVATPSARRMLRDNTVADIHTASTFNVVAYVNTTVSVPAGESSTAFFSTLTTSLSNTTAFTTNLHTAATTNGATVLSTATVTSVTTTDPVVVAPPSTDDDDDKLSGGAIAGIVIGVVVGFALICLAIYFVFFRKGAGSSAGDSNFNARHHRKSNELPITL